MAAIAHRQPSGAYPGVHIGRLVRPQHLPTSCHVEPHVREAWRMYRTICRPSCCVPSLVRMVPQDCLPTLPSDCKTGPRVARRTRRSEPASRIIEDQIEEDGEVSRA
jgi:hypothetical protein